MPFIYFKKLSAVVIIIFIKAKEKIMSAYIHISVFLVTVVNSKNKEPGYL